MEEIKIETLQGKFKDWLEKQPEVICRFSANNHPLANWLGKRIRAGEDEHWQEWVFEENNQPLPNWMQSIMYSTSNLPYGVRIYKQQALAWLAHSYTDTRYH